AAELDQEWRTTILGGEGEPSALLESQEPPGTPPLERLRQAARAKVLDALRRGEFRELLPGARAESPMEPGPLKSCLESAAPRLQACGGRRRLWLAGPCEAPVAELRAAIELETKQLPSMAVDAQSDFAVGWEIE